MSTDGDPATHADHADFDAGQPDVVSFLEAADVGETGLYHLGPHESTALAAEGEDDQYQYQRTDGDEEADNYRIPVGGTFTAHAVKL